MMADPPAGEEAAASSNGKSSNGKTDKHGELIAFGETGEAFTEENIARTYRTQIFSAAPAHRHAASH